MSSAEGQVSDETLMLRYQRGDKQAFTLLVRRHQGGLFNFAVRLIGAQSVAEEVVQEAFVKVVQNAAEFKHEARFSTWVYTIVRNLCIDQLRKRALRRHPSLDEPGGGARSRSSQAGEGDGPTLGERTEDPRASVERDVTGRELAKKIAAAVEALPDDQREVFLLREGANLPFKEIAVITKVSENTVKSRMRYALERLQEALSDYEEYAHALR
jgi:RNA polymerase sigma-70 factor, ECF subfamily